MMMMIDITIISIIMLDMMILLEIIMLIISLGIIVVTPITAYHMGSCIMIIIIQIKTVQNIPRKGFESMTYGYLLQNRSTKGNRLTLLVWDLTFPSSPPPPPPYFSPPPLPSPPLTSLTTPSPAAQRGRRRRGRTRIKWRCSERYGFSWHVIIDCID